MLHMQLWWVTRARELVEQGLNVGCDPGIRGKQAEIGVQARRVGSEVPAGNVRVAAHAAAGIAAHHERHLRVRLETHETRDDVRSEERRVGKECRSRWS